MSNGYADVIVMNRRVLREGEVEQVPGYGYEDGYLANLGDLRSEDASECFGGELSGALLARVADVVEDVIDDVRVPGTQVWVRVVTVSGDFWEFHPLLDGVSSTLPLGQPRAYVFEEADLPTRRCSKARRGSRRTEHGPHDFVAGEYLPVGDLGFPARCLGWTAPKDPNPQDPAVKAGWDAVFKVTHDAYIADLAEAAVEAARPVIIAQARAEFEAEASE